MHQPDDKTHARRNQPEGLRVLGEPRFEQGERQRPGQVHGTNGSERKRDQRRLELAGLGGARHLLAGTHEPVGRLTAGFDTATTTARHRLKTGANCAKTLRHGNDAMLDK